MRDFVWETAKVDAERLNVNCKNAELLQAMRIEGDLRLRVYETPVPGSQAGMIWLLLFILLILIVGIVGAVKIALWVILLSLLVAVLAGFMGRSLFYR